MAKTIVNIITGDNPVSAYLFAKEVYEAGDTLMLISAKDTEDDLDFLADEIGIPAKDIVEVLLRNDIDEFRYELICRTVKSYLKKDVKYWVNLAGGTRYMALAVQQVFEDFDSEFYYANIEDNQIIKSKFDDNIYNGDDYSYEIKHRLSVKEYLDIHDMEHDIYRAKEPIRPFHNAQFMFKLFVENKLKRDWRTFNILREFYRDCDDVPIQDIIRPKQNINPLPKFERFLKKIRFVPENPGILNKYELDWLTGGWFEEYTYYIAKEAVSPDDIKMAFRIWVGKDKERMNELDVIFTKNNKLFVIECKTGIQTGSMFNQIVYKACALKEALLGVYCNSYIFTLKEDDHKDVMERLAANMDIRLVDKDILTDPEAIENEWMHMLSIANAIS